MQPVTGKTEFGFINLNKPKDWTSHDCVAKVRRLLRIKRVGHGGTLDPAATGVLPIAVGKATRLLQFLPEEKAYRARIRLGVVTTTDDLEGEILETKSASQLTLENVQPLLKHFIGKIEQIPPAFSAIQRDGKRLYELAREGKEVDVPSRIVTVSNIEVLGWYPGEFPEIEVAIACGSGTYIRAIARDLGAALNTGGTLAQLTRTLSCSLQLDNSITLEDLERQLNENTFRLIPPDSLLTHLKAVKLTEDNAKRWCQGQKISEWEAMDERESAIAKVHAPNGTFLGISDIVKGEDCLLLKPKTVIV